MRTHQEEEEILLPTWESYDPFRSGQAQEVVIDRGSGGHHW